MRPSITRVVSLAILCVTVVACASPSGGQTGAARGGTEAAPAQPKRLIVGMLGERKGWAPWIASAGTATSQPAWLLTRSLAMVDGTGNVRPILAESIPTLEKGDWRIHPDGTMDQTWKLRPGAKWQDGRPLTADDFLFGWQILAQPELPSAGQSPARSVISGTTAPDPMTVTITFRRTTPLAGSAMFDPYPRHILGELFEAGDWERLINHDFWTTAYIGAGPYRITAWDPGTSQEFTAFPEYIEGPPRIDRILFRFFGDANTLMANVMGGDVDATIPDGITVDMAAQLKRTWAAPETGNQVTLYMDGRYSRVEFQHRAEYARPVASYDPRVRRAYYHTIDKEALNEVDLAGLGVLADSWIPPDDPRRAQLRDVIPPWSYDLALAQRILSEAGWQRGGDGVLVSSATGERMETEIQTALSARGQTSTILANGWRQVGAVMNENVLPTALATDREFRAKLPFAGIITHFVDMQYEYQHHACERASAQENNWSGAHYGYCSSQANPYILRLQATIPQNERTEIQREILRVMLQQDQAVLPIYWYVAVIVAAKGVKGLDPIASGVTGHAMSPWNAHLWDKSPAGT